MTAQSPSTSASGISAVGMFVLSLLVCVGGWVHGLVWGGGLAVACALSFMFFVGSVCKERFGL